MPYFIIENQLSYFFLYFLLVYLIPHFPLAYSIPHFPKPNFILHFPQAYSILNFLQACFIQGFLRICFRPRDFIINLFKLLDSLTQVCLHQTHFQVDLKHYFQLKGYLLVHLPLDYHRDL